MTCEDCKEKVSRILKGVAGINSVDIELEKNRAHITSDSALIIQLFQQALRPYPQYQL